MESKTKVNQERFKKLKEESIIKKLIIGSRLIIKPEDLNKNADEDFLIIKNKDVMKAGYLFVKGKPDVVVFKDNQTREEILELVKNVQLDMIVCSFLNEEFCRHFGFTKPEQLKGVYLSKKSTRKYQDKAFEFYCLNGKWSLTDKQYQEVLKIYQEERAKEIEE